MITAQAIRFSDDIAAMQQFLTTLGLSTAVTGSDWAVLRSGSGEVLLHGMANATSGAAHAETNLTFETDALDALAASLGVTPVDEAWARSLVVTDPLGAALQINETQTDYYGYQEHGGEPDAELSVVPVRFTDPRGPYADFLRRLGLQPQGGADESFALFAADRGFVGLHVDRPEESTQYVVPGKGPGVHLTFGYSGDLEVLAGRLRAAGYAPTIDTTYGPMLEVVDPDGRPVQVHASA